MRCTAPCTVPPTVHELFHAAHTDARAVVIERRWDDRRSTNFELVSTPGQTKEPKLAASACVNTIRAVY